MRWTLSDRTLTLHHPNCEVYWVMPADYQLPSRSVLTLAEHVLLSPYGEAVEVLPDTSIGSSHRHVALAFSGGVDSAAALNLLGDAVPIYTQVDNPAGSHRQENALLALEEVGGLAVRTNQDILPLEYGRKRGFYGNAGWTIPSILLSEHFGFNTFADGNIIDFVYLRTPNGHGTQFNPLNLDSTSRAFGALGFHYCLPCAGLSEVSTTRIARRFKYVMGCMRGTGGQPCLNCMKCYRKLAISGTPIPSNAEVESRLNKEWIPVLASLLWARDHSGLTHPRLDSIERDYSWVDKWYRPSLEFIPEHLRDSVSARLQAYGIEALEEEDTLHNWSSYVPVGGS